MHRFFDQNETIILFAHGLVFFSLGPKQHEIWTIMRILLVLVQHVGIVNFLEPWADDDKGNKYCSASEHGKNDIGQDRPVRVNHIVSHLLLC